MDCLTKHSKQTPHENGICCTHFLGPECLGVGGNCAMNCKWEEAAWSRLAAYEDTGLTPERCAEFARADAEGRYIVMRDAEQEGDAPPARTGRGRQGRAAGGSAVQGGRYGIFQDLRLQRDGRPWHSAPQGHGHCGARNCQWEVYRCRAVAGPVWSKLVSHPRGGGGSIGGDEGCLRYAR